MTWLKTIGGAILVLLGLVWMGQGINLLPGSVMSGQVQWVVIGALVALGGAWLFWTSVRSRARRV
jgi:hypothetical protein